MEIVITAVGPDNVGLADPIIHHVTGRGANIAEIQMYDHDEAAVFAMMCRLQARPDQLLPLRQAMSDIGQETGLEIRVWSPQERPRPRLAICTSWLMVGGRRPTHRWAAGCPGQSSQAASSSSWFDSSWLA